MNISGKWNDNMVSAAVRCLAVVLLCGNMHIASAAWTNGQAATFALGAVDLTTAGSGAATASSFGASDICTDPVTGKVFVMDINNNRILRFSSAQGIITNGTAEAVFGQLDFTSSTINNGGLSASSLQNPWACAIDGAGHLFVTDYGNTRVLRYDNAATKASSAAADGVLGQADFVSAATGTTATTFLGGQMSGIAIGSNGSLYVSDPASKRVLRFDNAASKANGAAADGVLGVPDFTTAGAGSVTASTFTIPNGLAVDAAGNLYVSDSNIASRVLRFNNAASKVNGAAADGVLGAPDFTTAGGGAASQSNFSNWVHGVAVAADGSLYVVDWNWGRVTIFNNAAGKANGANADNVLGQLNFTATASGTTASSFNSPNGVGINPVQGYLMVADYHNQRVMGFYNASLLPAPSAPASIPTLDEWGTITLACLLAIGSIVTLRRRPQNS